MIIFDTKGEDSIKHNNRVKLSGKRTEKGIEAMASLFCPFYLQKKNDRLIFSRILKKMVELSSKVGIENVRQESIKGVVSLI